MKTLVFLACAYTASVLFNTIQIARFLICNGDKVSLIQLMYIFLFVCLRPSSNIFGLYTSLKNWNWMFERIDKDENGRYRVKREKGEEME